MFNILLPWKGFTATFKYVDKEVPMKIEIKEQFKRRLVKIRNLVVADVAITNGIEIDDLQQGIV